MIPTRSRTRALTALLAIAAASAVQAAPRVPQSLLRQSGGRRRRARHAGQAVEDARAREPAAAPGG